MNARELVFYKFPLLVKMFFAFIQAFETLPFCNTFIKRNKIGIPILNAIFLEVFSYNEAVILLNKLRQIAFAHFEFFST